MTDREGEIDIAGRCVINRKSCPETDYDHNAKDQEQSKDFWNAVRVCKKRHIFQLPRDGSSIDQRYQKYPNKIVDRLQEHMRRDQ